MNSLRRLSLPTSCALGAVLLAAVAGAQETPAPQPGAEHAVLAKCAGTWDVIVSAHGAPDSKSVEVSRMLGGRWLITEFKGDMGGQPFEGHGTFGYDPDKKKYVGTWVDTQTTSLMVQEGDLSADGKTLTMWSEMKNPMGEGTMKVKMVDTWTGPDERTFAIKMPLPDGQEVDMLTMAYKRRK